MRIPHERIRGRGHNLMLDRPWLAPTPFFAGALATDFLLEHDLPDLVRFPTMLALGVLANRKAQGYFGYKVVWGGEDDEFIFDTASTWPEDRQAPRQSLEY